MKRLLLIILLASGCSHYVIHPGAPNAQASVAFDVLLTAKATIDEGKLQLAKGGLPLSAKAPLNVLIAAYDTAAVSLRAYSDAVTSSAPAADKLIQLNANLQKVEVSLLAFQKVKK